ncbi:Os11g0470600, partial [Oryza sativa Japonica Group]
LVPASRPSAVAASPPPDRRPPDLAYEAWIRPPRPRPQLSATSSSATTSPTAGSGHRSLSPECRPLPPPPLHRQPPDPASTSLWGADPTTAASPPTVGRFLLCHRTTNRWIRARIRPPPPPPLHHRQMNMIVMIFVILFCAQIIVNVK